MYDLAGGPKTLEYLNQQFSIFGSITALLA